jgi:hypothetical protein
MTSLHRACMVLAGIVVSLLSLAGTAPASASTITRDPPPGVLPAHPLAPAVRTIVVGGMPGWQIALIAVAAALVAAIAAVLLERARTARPEKQTEMTDGRQGLAGRGAVG